MFDPVESSVSFAEKEEKILSFWQENKIFEKSLSDREGAEEYFFYDGPPFATGKPHYGHLLAGTIKDVVPRYQTMRGKHVERVFGWDCHGLPIEALAQEALDLAGTAAILETGVDVFNEKCRSMVDTYVNEWEKTVNRMGRWVDFQNGYRTMDKDFMETIWWVFKQLWDQGRIYKSYRIMPYSWKLTTPLSNFEATSNYKDVQDPDITVRVKLTHSDASLEKTYQNIYALVWTTTPWTLPENLALCVGPDIEYVAIEDKDNKNLYIMAESRLAVYYKDESEYSLVKRYKGTELENWAYEPLFPYFKDNANSFRILVDSFVSTEDGTGVVHMAPAYGEDDFRICKEQGIKLVDPLDENCVFTDEISEFAGQFCKDADKAIMKMLKDEEKLVRRATLNHSYPYCERTDTPLIYRAIDSWYIKVEDYKEDLIELNEKINWTPDYVGSKRFANWLKGAKDWNVSRNRYWGSCIPVWISEDGTDSICVGSIVELEELSGKKVDDLHKHIVDKITFTKDGKLYRRTPEVLDCWFESGSMPYAQHHFPFEHEVDLKNFFPANFIAEGLDQTRGWFYTLLVLGSALFKKSPYQNVIVNGLVLAEDGQKMSKRKQNYPDPHYMIDKYGADAIRLFLLGSPVVRGENLKFSEDGVIEILRKVIIPLWNAYSFLVTYANVDNWEPEETPLPPKNPENLLDKWILSSLEQMIDEIQQEMDNYNLQQAANRFEKFIEDLTNWYIRRSRRRFWKSENDSDKLEAYKTLHYVLLTFTKTAAPFIPFTTEMIYRNLKTQSMPQSVHLCDYPVTDGRHRDSRLEKQMEDAMTATSLGRFLRAQQSLRVRQPLKEAILVSTDENIRKDLQEMSDVIADELNVKKVTIDSNEEDLVTLSAVANYKELGRQLGPAMKEVAGKIKELSSYEVSAIMNGEGVELSYSGGTLQLTENEVDIRRSEKQGMIVANEGLLTVAIATEIDEPLKLEGLAREIVSKIQNMRREEDFHVADKICLHYDFNYDLQKAFNQHYEYIAEETLLAKAQSSKLEELEEIELTKDYHCRLKIEKMEE